MSEPPDEPLPSRLMIGCMLFGALLATAFIIDWQEGDPETGKARVEQPLCPCRDEEIHKEVEQVLREGMRHL